MDALVAGDLRTTLQMMAVLGTVLSGFLFVRALRARAWRRELKRAPAPPLGALPDVCASRPSGVAVVVDGNAEPGPRGPLTAPYSSRDCVWYRTEVWAHHPWDDEEGNRIRLDMVFAEQSDRPFVLRDRTGEALCSPHGARTDRIRVTHESFVPDASAEVNGAVIGPDRDRAYQPEQMLFSVGHTYRERSIAPGARLLVYGTAHVREERAVIDCGADGRLVLSSRTGPQLREAQRVIELAGLVLFPGAVVITLLLVLA